MSELIQQPIEDSGLATWTRDAQRCITNFQGDERESFVFRMKCLNALAGGVAALGLVIPVRHWLIHEVDFVSEETGETVRTFRTVLVRPDGTALSFVSQGVANGVRQIFNQFGDAPLDPPLRVRIEQRETAKKRRVYVLIVVPDEPSLTA